MAPPEWDMLLSAAQKNRPELIREMIEIGGVSPSHANAVGQSALHIAALWGHVESVQALVDCGAAVNAQNNMTGATPLHMVAQSSKGSIDRRLQVIDLLIASGANVEQADNYGSLPVHAFRNDTEDEANEDSQRFVSKLEPQRPEIQDAIDEGCVPKLKEILAKDSAAADRRLSVLSRTPVDYAVDKLIQAAEEEEDISKGDSIGILKELLSTGGNANGEDKEANDAALIGEINEPPLYKVVVALRELYKQGEKASATSSCASLETAVDLLVQAGAVVTPETTQLLHQAARRNEVTFACFLVQRLRVDPNAKGRQGMTPLHFAARSGQIEMVRFLLNQPGIDIDTTDDRGKTALDAAQVNHKDDVIEALTQC